MAFLVWLVVTLLCCVGAWQFSVWQQSDSAGWFMLAVLLLFAPVSDK